ncbi:MAG: substrate-binding domain-containing protein [Lachnospiraceae bacterium]|nr:substrate-binding domain-containing protein [Lachnospiraceae bacterium]
MKKRRYLLTVLLFSGMLALGGCGASAQSIGQVEGLDALGEVQVISREEGSGTRSAFAGLVGFDGSEDEEKEDGTTDNAVIVNDADAVIAAVREDASAIGYISMGSLEELGDETVLTVDGADGTRENVKSGDYALSRPFLLVWSGELNDLEEDFLTYINGKGQEIVSESYVAVNDAATFLSGQYEGTITISGSTSAAPLLEELAAEYMTINTHAVIKVTASDSTSGINDAMQGRCDLGALSRELKDYEKELLDSQVFAYDGIAVIVNSENPLTEITTAELKDLFTGTITAWEEINIGRE